MSIISNSSLLPAYLLLFTNVIDTLVFIKAIIYFMYINFHSRNF